MPRVLVRVQEDRERRERAVVRDDVRQVCHDLVALVRGDGERARGRGVVVVEGVDGGGEAGELAGEPARVVFAQARDDERHGEVGV